MQTQERKEAMYRCLGATQFQKIVFWAEKKKYQIMDTFFPNIETWYENRCNQILKKRYRQIAWRKNAKGYQIYQKIRLKGIRTQIFFLDKVFSQEKPERIEQFRHNLEKKETISFPNEEEIKREIQLEKLRFRKERNYRQNRNYHYDRNHPTELEMYLRKNKQIHLQGMRRDLLFLGGSGMSIVLMGPTWIGGLCLAISSVSLLVDFECVNLQNYHLCRLENKKLKQRLEKEEIHKTKENLQKLSEVYTPIATLVQEKEEIPTIEEVLDKMTTKEEVTQLLEYAKEQLCFLQSLKEQQAEEAKPIQKKIGERK